MRFSPKRGDWLLDHLWWAELQLELLKSANVHVGEHVCKLELEEYNGVFAIVCAEHPSASA